MNTTEMTIKPATVTIEEYVVVDNKITGFFKRLLGIQPKVALVRRRINETANLNEDGTVIFESKDFREAE